MGMSIAHGTPRRGGGRGSLGRGRGKERAQDAEKSFEASYHDETQAHMDAQADYTIASPMPMRWNVNQGPNQQQENDHPSAIANNVPQPPRPLNFMALPTPPPPPPDASTCQCNPFYQACCYQYPSSAPYYQGYQTNFVPKMIPAAPNALGTISADVAARSTGKYGAMGCKCGCGKVTFCGCTASRWPPGLAGPVGSTSEVLASAAAKAAMTAIPGIPPMGVGPMTTQSFAQARIGGGQEIAGDHYQVGALEIPGGPAEQTGFWENIHCLVKSDILRIAKKPGADYHTYAQEKEDFLDKIRSGDVVL
jgi:hypothetical protein